MLVPPGFHFRPTDDELIEYYLLKKDAGTLPLAHQNHVKECDLYGNQEPWEIWEKYGGNNLVDFEYLYFFTKLKKKSMKKNPSEAHNASRKVGRNGGNWDRKAKGKTFFLFSKERGTVEVEKKTFKYKPNKNSSAAGNEESRWMMVEYSVESLESGWVVCCLKHDSSSGSSTKRRRVDYENQNSDDNKRVAEAETVDVADNLMETEGLVSDFNIPKLLNAQAQVLNDGKVEAEVAQFDFDQPLNCVYNSKQWMGGNFDLPLNCVYNLNQWMDDNFDQWMDSVDTKRIFDKCGDLSVGDFEEFLGDPDMRK